MIEVPLTNDVSQTFSILIEDVKYDVEVSYNKRLGLWMMNVSSNGTILANGIALSSGVDIVGQYTFFEKKVFVINVDDPSKDPAFENLGIESKLLILEEGEIGA